MPSTLNLAVLPDPLKLKKLCQSLAMLDAIFSPDFEFRYHSLNARWTEDAMLASVRDGAGDELFVLFDSSGAIGKGFAHESPMTPYRTHPPRVWPGVLDDVPPQFAYSLAEPAFSISDTTFCFWRTPSDTNWHRGKVEFPKGHDPDGSYHLLFLFDGNPQTYQDWAQDYYERPIDLAAVTHLYKHQPLSQNVLRQLDPALLLDELAQDQQEIGYPDPERS